MELNLGIIERMQVMNMLPQKGNMMVLTVAEDIKTKLTITQEEIASYGVEVTDTMITCKDLKTVPFTFTEAEIKLLRDKVAELDKANELQANLLALYKKIKG